MKIALILPPITLEERYNKVVAHMAGSLPPLGLLSIGTMLKQAGHDVMVYDGSIMSFDAIMAEIGHFAPQVIGITAMTVMWPKVKFLSAKIKERWPKINIIVGGVHATMIKENALSELPNVDAVAWGEGEYSMLDYVEKTHDPRRTQPIDGIAFRLMDGSVAKGRDREPITDLDALPIPDRTMVPVTKYVSAFEQYKRLPVTNIITARGCPFKCIFCLPSLLGKGVRYRSTEKVIEEIEYLLTNFGIRDVAFWDDTFTVNKKRVFEICECIIEKRLDFIWSAQARADCVTPAMLEMMARSGCWKLFFGVESLVQKNLNTLRKGEGVKQIFEAVKWTKKAGIEVEASFIFGIPGETFREGLETIRLAKILDPDYAKFFFLTPYGDFLKEAKIYGTIIDEDQTRYGGSAMRFIPFSMSREELGELYYRAYRQFYLRPKMAWRRMKKICDPIEFEKSINGLRAIAAFVIEELKSRTFKKRGYGKA